MLSEARFADLRKFLEHHGWPLVRISGSHHIFVKEGEGHLSVPVNKGRVRRCYLRQIEKRLGISLR